MIFTLILLSSFRPDRAKPYGLATVVIDAGHGGHDSGCLGRKSKEKDIALSISLKLGKYIEDHFPDVNVVYTRKTDEFVELYERANIANNAHADLFICIHCNSACVFNKKKKKEICSPEISGVESWVMGLNKSDENLEVSKRENEVILLEKDYTKQYGGFDPNSPEANIIFSLYQNTYIDQSLRLASLVQQEIKTSGRTGRGVKQAGFLVLYKTYMPSILIETGFLSNAAEEKFLLSGPGQDKIANSIFKAFKAYKNSIETTKNNKEVIEKTDTPVVKKKDEEKKTEVFKNNADDTIVKPKPKDSDDIEEAKKEVIIKKEEPKKEEIKKEAVEKMEPKNAPSPVESKSSDDLLQWSVQFYTSPKPLPDNSKIYDAFDDVREDFENGMYKYSTGLLSEKNEAIKLQTKLRQQGYKDAFLIAFLNNKKISVKEATEKSRKK